MDNRIFVSDKKDIRKFTLTSDRSVGGGRSYFIDFEVHSIKNCFDSGTLVKMPQITGERKHAVGNLEEMARIILHACEIAKKIEENWENCVEFPRIDGAMEIKNDDLDKDS